jgi:alkylation response protein AidB-like acyl-CoA dehydrogenase
MDGATLGRAVRGLAPQIVAAREAIEQERGLPTALVEALGAAGMFALWLPNSLGGPELGAGDRGTVPTGRFRRVVRIGRFAYSAIAGHLPPDVAHRIYSGGRTVVAGAVKPNGKAFFADDGYRVTGHWAYGSGITHSSWTLGGCVVHDANGPRKGPDGEPEVRQVLFPTSATEVIDTWHVSGLRGTGSHDYRVGDVFVSERYTIPFPPQARPAGYGMKPRAERYLCTSAPRSVSHARTLPGLRRKPGTSCMMSRVGARSTRLAIWRDASATFTHARST